MKCVKEDLVLYAVTDRSWLHGKTLYEQVEQALKGGVTFVQLREKNLNKEQVLKEAVAIKALCKQYQVPFVINDQVELALAVDADGVHVGQSDMEALQARAKLGPNKIIGVSVQTVEQAMLAEQQGADYLGVGAVFATTSKDDATKVCFQTLQAICRAVTIPVVAIGGINKNNLEQLSTSGISGIAVISSIFAQNNIEQASKELKEIIQRMISCN